MSKNHLYTIFFIDKKIYLFKLIFVFDIIVSYHWRRQHYETMLVMRQGYIIGIQMYFWHLLVY